MADNISSSDTNHTNPFMKFFSNPIIGITGSVSSILGIALAVFFFLSQQQKRDLVVFVHPVRVPIVKTGQTSQLSVQLEGTEITTDVIAAQVALWNRGNLPIHSYNILKPVKLVMPGCRILEATLRKQSRDVIGMKLDTSALTESTLGISWDILENNDGGVIQIIYSGKDSVPIELQGIIEGQRDLSHMHYFGTVIKPEEQYRTQRSRNLLIGWIQIGYCIIIVAILIFRHISLKRQSKKLSRLKYVGMIVIVFILLCSGVLSLFQAKQIGPPFGF